MNSHLVSGPDLLNNLVVIFMGFIEEKIALSGDIKRQCLTKLLSHQRIKLPSVFPFSPESEIEVYQYQRHIAGAKCAPKCSNYALLRTAEENGQ